MEMGLSLVFRSIAISLHGVSDGIKLSKGTAHAMTRRATVDDITPEGKSSSRSVVSDVSPTGYGLRETVVHPFCFEIVKVGDL